MITLTMKCGHRMQVDPDRVHRPSCPQCGETVVARVQAPAPTFVGTVTGPLSETKYMEPAHVDLAPGGPLKLRDQETEED